MCPTISENPTFFSSLCTDIQSTFQKTIVSIRFFKVQMSILPVQSLFLPSLYRTALTENRFVDPPLMQNFVIKPHGFLLGDHDIHDIRYLIREIRFKNPLSILKIGIVSICFKSEFCSQYRDRSLEAIYTIQIPPAGWSSPNPAHPYPESTS